MHTRNHPHWSEGSWDSPILSPPPSLEDILTDKSQLTEPGENIEPVRNGIVEVIGGALGDLIGGIGKVLGGVWDAGVAILGPVVDGVVGFLDGIVRGIGGAISSLFGGGSGPPPVTEIDEPSIWSPIKADLEGALKPHFDTIDEQVEISQGLAASIDSLNAEARGLNDELGVIRGRMEDINTRLDSTVGESGSILAEIEALNDIMQEEFGPGGAVSVQIDALRQDLEYKISASGEVGQRMESLRGDLEAVISGTKSDIEGNIASQISSLNTSMSSSISSLATATEEDYQKLNTALWGEQGDINKLNAENDERQREYQKINNDLWGEQGELNALNKLMWNDQGDLNENFQDLFDMQLEFNDNQTGFNKKMQEFNELQLKWNDEDTGWKKQQEAINATNTQLSEELKERDDALEKMNTELREALEETQDYVARMLPIPKVAVNNGHFAVTRLSNGNYRVKALGNWVGQMVWQGVWTGDGQASLEIHDVGVKREWDIISFNHHPSLITYWIHEGEPREVNLRNDGFKPDQYHHRTVMTWNVPSHLPEITVSIYYRISWDAATYDDWYNSRITKNTTSTSDSLSSSYIVANYGKRTHLGPLLPGQNGYRSMTLNEAKVTVKGGDTIRFQAHSSAGLASQRLLRHAYVDIGYIDPTANDN